jgi:hypothetical protein
MNLLNRIRIAIKNIFCRGRNPKSSVAARPRQAQEKTIPITAVRLKAPLSSDRVEISQKEGFKFPIFPHRSTRFFSKDDFSMLPAPKANNELFFPNRGELDPTVSTISNGREEREILTYQHEDFARKYGHLTTDLGYGLIYSIIHNAHVNEDRTLKSALREAIARSADPLLCVAVLKDYCLRNTINYDKYEAIAIDLIKRREALYGERMNGIGLESISLSLSEKEDLDKSKWLYNGKLIEKSGLYLKVKIHSQNKTLLIREFSKRRILIEGQNLVVQWDGEESYRVLDFKQL